MMQLTTSGALSPTGTSCLKVEHTNQTAHTHVGLQVLTQSSSQVLPSCAVHWWLEQQADHWLCALSPYITNRQLIQRPSIATLAASPTVQRH